MAGNLLLIFVLVFTIYILTRIAKTGATPDPTGHLSRVYKRMFLGGLIGFILGFGIAFILNPPYEGIWDTPADVQGLIMASWLTGGGIGALLLAFIGLLTSGRQHKSP